MVRTLIFQRAEVGLRRKEIQLYATILRFRNGALCHVHSDGNSAEKTGRWNEVRKPLFERYLRKKMLEQLKIAFLNKLLLTYLVNSVEHAVCCVVGSSVKGRLRGFPKMRQNFQTTPAFSQAERPHHVLHRNTPDPESYSVFCEHLGQ